MLMVSMSMSFVFVWLSRKKQAERTVKAGSRASEAK